MAVTGALNLVHILFGSSHTRRMDMMGSQLAHGSLSPFDPEVAAFAPTCLQRIEQVICWGLGLFESQELFDRELTNRQLAEGFDGLIVFAQQRDGAPGEVVS